jgi:serine/threonine-protein kinase
MSSTPTLELPGYQVIQFLGSGARSTIWEVRNIATDEVVAIKRVVKRTSEDSRFLDQAINEYEVGSQFNHPAIRKILELQRLRRWISIKEVRVVMEYAQGQSIQQSRPAGVPETVMIFLEVGAALGHMNAKGFVHADTKPNNIIVSRDQTVKVIDFGQSCPIGTVKARIQGTPDFIAPEQVHRRPLDGRTDVFNFGATLYWTLAGRPIQTVLPKEGSLTLNVGQRIPPVEQFNPDVPRSLSKLIADCVELNPAQRPTSMNEVVSRLTLIDKQIGRDTEVSI